MSSAQRAATPVNTLRDSFFRSSLTAEEENGCHLWPSHSQRRVTTCEVPLFPLETAGKRRSEQLRDQTSDAESKLTGWNHHLNHLCQFCSSATVQPGCNLLSSTLSPSRSIFPSPSRLGRPSPSLELRRCAWEAVSDKARDGREVRG